MFYPYSIKVNKCRGSCNNISNPYARLCVPDVAKNMSLKVFNLMTWNNSKTQIKLHESCKCECKLNSSACNNKQRWNKDKCRCEYKELVNKQGCEKGFFWNSSNCNHECDKSCNISEYLDYKNCKYRKKGAYSLVEECDENIDKNEVIHNETLSIKEYNKSTNEDLNTSSSSDPCKPYVALSILFLMINVTISGAFVYFYLNSRSKKELQTYYY